MWIDYDDIEEQKRSEEAQDRRLDAELEKYLKEKRKKDLRRTEQAAFEDAPKCGKHAHAYNDSYDNILIYEMREKKMSFQKIADKFGCSKSTIKNRYDKMKKAKQEEERIKNYIKSFLN